MKNTGTLGECQHQWRLGKGPFRKTFQAVALGTSSLLSPEPPPLARTLVVSLVIVLSWYYNSLPNVYALGHSLLWPLVEGPWQGCQQDRGGQRL